ncbi:hypothetical protein [Faecalicoccus pleomorphus]|uniref:hypothetical protein n=1 Tax=Faecalicoccus pleomorphus TaxID=1323 RepID=UPI0025A3A44D|nr:hypothetical protein [Faecalicoccus pleomorphus]MDM8292062.1 hypothetical protein [Faecalicoccus pleomorphus]
MLKNKELPLSLQAIFLKREYPNSICKVSRSQLVWHGLIKPSPLSREYNIRMICDGKKRPKVILYGENVKGLDDPNFPHNFGINQKKQEVTICLHYSFEFDYSMRIVDTIIPWIQEWLYFYKIWLITGEWLGGGHSPHS